MPTKKEKKNTSHWYVPVIYIRRIQMVKLIVKRTIGTLVAVALLAIVNLYLYKVTYLAREVPAEIKSKHAETIIIDGVIFDNRLRGMFGDKELNRLRELFGSRKFVDMPAKTKQLIELVKQGKKNITIQLHSGGGLMEVGMEFVAAMRGAQRRGVDITCVVDNHAMSMALIIFSECDNRYATFGSKVMWHSIAMQGMFKLNQFKASEIFNYMLAKNEEVWASTRIHFMPWYFVEHFKEETILDVSEVEREGIGYLRVIDKLTITDKPKPVVKKKKKVVKVTPVIRYNPKVGDYVVITKGLFRGLKGPILSGAVDGSSVRVVVKKNNTIYTISVPVSYIKPVIKSKKKGR